MFTGLIVFIRKKCNYDNLSRGYTQAIGGVQKMIVSVGHRALSSDRLVTASDPISMNSCLTKLYLQIRSKCNSILSIVCKVIQNFNKIQHLI